MSESTKRTVRTLYQGIIALVTTVPAIIAVLPDGLPFEAQLASVVAGIAVVTKVLNVLEDKGLIPAWLRTDPTEAPAS